VTRRQLVVYVHLVFGRKVVFTVGLFNIRFFAVSVDVVHAIQALFVVVVGVTWTRVAVKVFVFVVVQKNWRALVASMAHLVAGERASRDLAIVVAAG